MKWFIGKSNSVCLHWYEACCGLILSTYPGLGILQFSHLLFEPFSYIHFYYIIPTILIQSKLEITDLWQYHTEWMRDMSKCQLNSGFTVCNTIQYNIALLQKLNICFSLHLHSTHTRTIIWQCLRHNSVTFMLMTNNCWVQLLCSVLLLFRRYWQLSTLHLKLMWIF